MRTGGPPTVQSAACAGAAMPDVYMMSLRKPWSDLTVDGVKTMELRRSGCAIPPGSLVYIYESGAKGAGAIVGSVVLDRVEVHTAQWCQDPATRVLHRVPPDHVADYAATGQTRFDGGRALMPLTCIVWQPGSAVRFPTPIPAPCKAVPTWRKLSNAERFIVAEMAAVQRIT